MTRALTLFSLQLRHDYHPDGVCRGLDIVPTTATQRLLDRYRLRLLPRPGGVAVAALTGADGKSPWIALPRDEVFGFDLSLLDPAFARYTDLQALATLADPVYRNPVAAGAAADPVLVLAERECWRTETFVAAAKAARIKFALAGSPLALDGDAAKRPRAADLRLLAPAGTAKPSAYDAATRSVTFASVVAGQRLLLRYRCLPARQRQRLAAVELRYDKSMPVPGSADRPFEIRLQARAARWAYYLLTDQTGDFSIVDAAPSGPALAFGASNRTALDKASDETDAVAQALARQHASLRRWRFLSDQPVPCSSAIRRGLELRLGDQKVLEAMPNPALESLSRILPRPGAQQAGQDTFHQVVRYLKAV